jgi:hypothetical protein
MLAWWGIIPLSGFVLIQATFGWSEAKVRATSPEYAFSYLVGKLIGGMLISLVISWIVFRATRKSQLAATIAFSSILGLLSLPALIGPQLRRPEITDLEQRPAPNANSATTPAVRLDSENFSFEVPKKWLQGRSDQKKTKALLLLGGSRLDLAKGMIMVDVGVPVFPTAQAMAESFHGQVAKSPVDVDGEKGLLVTTSSDNLDKPRTIIIIFRGGKVYLIMAASKEGADTTAAVETIRTSWKWKG